MDFRPTATPAANPMEYIKAAFTRNYANFSGRARRSEFWFTYLAYTVYSILTYIIAGVIDPGLFSDSNEEGALGALILLLLLVLGVLPMLAVTVRRLHDIGKSGWMYLVGFVPLIGGLILLYFLVQDSEVDTNKWGPSPKYQGAHTDPSGTVSMGQSQQVNAAPDIGRSVSMGRAADSLPADPGERKYGRQ